MRKAIERFVFVTACCSLLAALPLHSAQAQPSTPTIESPPVVDVAIASHFTPAVAAPPATIGVAPIDPGRPIFGACGGHGGGCLEADLGFINGREPTFDCGSFCQ